MTRHRMASGGSNWTLTLSSTKGVLLVDTTMGITLPISLPKGRVGVCYEVQLESDSLGRVSREEGSAPCDVITTTTTATTTTTTTPPPTITPTPTTTPTTTTTSSEAATATSKRRRGSARAAPDPPRTLAKTAGALGRLPRPDLDCSGRELPATEAEACEDGAERDVGWVLLVAAVIIFI
ncbi:integumentary mucin C.1-like [Penaeus monodon]|uniref:integumentary mucin C.1-like n=1 Tax=Penaeus monodon TaxID=6687 RepID=UPI0018A78684|nr:integumentary mucin C.1-like [Penaeus monodon]